MIRELRNRNKIAPAGRGGGEGRGGGVIRELRSRNKVAPAGRGGGWGRVRLDTNRNEIAPERRGGDGRGGVTRGMHL